MAFVLTLSIGWSFETGVSFGERFNDRFVLQASVPYLKRDASAQPGPAARQSRIWKSREDFGPVIFPGLPIG
jgi:hypothetical protein